MYTTWKENYLEITIVGHGPQSFFFEALSSLFSAKKNIYVNLNLRMRNDFRDENFMDQIKI